MIRQVSMKFKKQAENETDCLVSSFKKTKKRRRKTGYYFSRREEVVVEEEEEFGSEDIDKWQRLWSPSSTTEVRSTKIFGNMTTASNFLAATSIYVHLILSSSFGVDRLPSPRQCNYYRIQSNNNRSRRISKFSRISN